MENFDFVECKLCGWKGKQIGTGHLFKHKITAKEYQRMFPGAQITCGELKQRLSKIAKARPPQSEEKKKCISKTMKKYYAENDDFPLKLQHQDMEGEKNPFYRKTHTEETKKKISEKSTEWLLKAYEESRKISPFSYLGNGKQPSSFEIEVYRILKPLGFIREYQIPFKKGCYKIDFAHVQNKIAIEIDSALHNTEKARRVDRAKDFKLQLKGWKVCRIKFNACNDNPIDLAEKVFHIAKEIINENHRNKKS